MNVKLPSNFPTVQSSSPADDIPLPADTKTIKFQPNNKTPGATPQPITPKITPFSSKSLKDNPNNNPTPADNTPGAPTIGELKQASADAYDPAASAPKGWKPFTDGNGKPMVVNNGNGLTGRAWVTDKNKVVIVYEGTNILNPSSILADLPVALKQTSAGEKDAVNFANNVLNAAKSEGYNSNDVFVTGHSLGGIEAEYVAQQTGLGGAAFDATGIPDSPGAKGNGSNFTNYLHDGDPVSNYGSDVDGDGKYKPTDLAHYGNTVFFGDPASQTQLETDANATNLGGVALDFIKNHVSDGIPADPPYVPPASS